MAQATADTITTTTATATTRTAGADRLVDPSVPGRPRGRAGGAQTDGRAVEERLEGELPPTRVWTATELSRGCSSKNSFRLRSTAGGRAACRDWPDAGVTRGVGPLPVSGAEADFLAGGTIVPLTRAPLFCCWQTRCSACFQSEKCGLLRNEVEPCQDQKVLLF